MAQHDPIEVLKEEKRALDREFDALMAEYERVAPFKRFDVYRYSDKARSELELATIWIGKLRRTFQTAVDAGAKA